MTVVLVTGGAGYIGSHAAKALAQAGYAPVVFDNLSRGHEWAVKWGPFIRGDLHDAAALDDVFERHRPQAVMHFAAFAYVGESMSDPYLYYRNNVGGTLSLLAAMRRAGCGKIVFSSTCATYGVPEKIPITEETPQNPVNPYGASKLMTERVLADADAAYGLKSVALRYFNAAGADPDGEIGEAHDPETHLIPLALEAAAGMREELRVFGDDYDTPDGSCVRDYIHVADLADAHVLALGWLLNGRPSRIFNLGNGRGFSVFEVLNAVERVTGRRPPYRIAARRAGDPPVLVADAGRAEAELGWRPARPALEAQIADAWRWLRIRSSKIGSV
ncbi:MAG: UDP-glucose 4-epimerase GalE [Amphiplicatus sp.]